MSLSDIKKQCENCTKCVLSQTRTNIVFGDGNENAKLMFVGEAPGKNEDLQGIPFVGAAGKLLNKYLDAVGIPRDAVYIANILKCRPPQNRDPLPEEENACIPYLDAQIDTIKPAMIICLGRIAAKRLIKSDFAITKERGQWFERNGYRIMAIYHPAALIYDNKKKEVTYDDFKMLKAEYDKL